MLFIHNIQSVAKYESKILLRSWFFKVFMFLALAILLFFNFGTLITEDAYLWIAKAIPANIPYINLLLLNTGQAVIAIFLSSEFLKRDKKLDTSEVFYVRPLSNAEYVIGKIWGNLRVFLVLNLIIMVMALVFNFMAKGVPVDWLAYITYFFLISIPTLIFIIGLSIFLMLVFKNQALTFIILLGYIGLTIFYISDKFYYLFDYMAYSLPLLKSTIVGFTNLGVLINHRAIYLFFGLGFIFFTIYQFKRLPNSTYSHYPWLFLSLIMFGIGGTAGFRHVHSILHQAELRTMYTSLNNKYVHTPKMVIEQYDISVEQAPDDFSSDVMMTGVALETSKTFTFCLNPGLKVLEVNSDNKKLDFTRDNQIMLVTFSSEIVKGDTVSLTVKYKGRIDETLCYLDIPKKLLEEKFQNFLYNIDKKYSFQTKDYMLFTPETYWYPRPGTSYSDESPDWQQTYFSKFNLKVKTLPGLVPVSQGKSLKDKDSIYVFTSDFPAQSITLAVGKYKQKSIMADSTEYNIFYIDGHDFFSAPFDSILDTIPTLIKYSRSDLERSYKLSYPFKRFSIVEVPAQFSSYTRTWSQAQETVQPEMVLFPEKGFPFYQMDFVQNKKRQIRWSKYDGREINDYEASMRTFRNTLWMFSNTDGNFNFSSGGRGTYQITSKPNPYFLFPQLYNFRYNIFSPEWPVANRLIELYLQRKSDNNGWERQINGISNNEKSSLMMEKNSFKELLSDPENRDLMDNIVSLKANTLFANPEMSLGVNVFRDSLYAVLKRNTFKNVQLEVLLDTLSMISDTDIKSFIPEWNKSTKLPLYIVGRPVVTQIRNRDEEVFLFDLMIRNDSENEGVVNVNISVGGWNDPNPDPRKTRKIKLAAHQTKRLVSLWDQAPRGVEVNTMVSGNLPGFVYQQVGKVEKERRRVVESDSDYVVPFAFDAIPGEIIIDNEDSTSFTLSEPDVVGLLPKWLDKVGTSSFKYSGIGWRSVLEWTATTNEGYYGKYIRSAYVIRSGKGNQTATWTAKIPTAGRYDVYYYVYKDGELRWNRNAEGEYHFKVKYDNEVEDAYIDLRKAEDGWEPLGIYDFEAGTVTVTLTNECKLRTVTADAVRFVKR